MMPQDSTCAKRLDQIRAAVSVAAEHAGQPAGSCELIAVSKTFDAEHIEPVIQAGQKLFGENRVQEAQGKWPALREKHPGLELHLIGPLQSNKAGDAVALFDVIHTIDRPRIAKAIAAEMERQGRIVKLLVQVNTGEEPQKAGAAPGEARDFVSQCQQEFGLTIEGLMCIPPLGEEAALHFALLKKLADEMGLAAISMGMSADFETAIAFGATYVRVGSAIFGTRA